MTLTGKSKTLSKIKMAGRRRVKVKVPASKPKASPPKSPKTPPKSPKPPVSPPKGKTGKSSRNFLKIINPSTGKELLVGGQAWMSAIDAGGISKKLLLEALNKREREIAADYAAGGKNYVPFRAYGRTDAEAARVIAGPLSKPGSTGKKSPTKSSSPPKTPAPAAPKRGSVGKKSPPKPSSPKKPEAKTPAPAAPKRGSAGKTAVAARPATAPASGNQMSPALFRSRDLNVSTTYWIIDGFPQHKPPTKRQSRIIDCSDMTVHEFSANGHEAAMFQIFAYLYSEESGRKMSDPETDLDRRFFAKFEAPTVKWKNNLWITINQQSRDDPKKAPTVNPNWATSWLRTMMQGFSFNNVGHIVVIKTEETTPLMTMVFSGGFRIEKLRKIPKSTLQSWASQGADFADYLTKRGAVGVSKDMFGYTFGKIYSGSKYLGRALLNRDPAQGSRKSRMISKALAGGD